MTSSMIGELDTYSRLIWGRKCGGGGGGSKMASTLQGDKAHLRSMCELITLCVCACTGHTPIRELYVHLLH